VEVEDLKQKLEEKFPNTPIVRLKDLTKKIAGISKVRRGKEEYRTFYDYAEISFLYKNKLDYFYIPKSYEGHPPANPNSIRTQALNYHDLIIAKRSQYYFNMGLIDKSYDPFKTIVGNNGMIRVEFDADRKEDTPVYVMQYLKLPFVQEFIYKENSPSESSVYNSINLETLRNLPIPAFEECNGQYKDYVHSRLQDYASLHSIRDKIHYLSNYFNNLELTPNGNFPFNTNIEFSQEVESIHKNAQLLKDMENQIDQLIDKDAYKAYKDFEESIPF